MGSFFVIWHWVKLWSKCFPYCGMLSFLVFLFLRTHWVALLEWSWLIIKVLRDETLCGNIASFFCLVCEPFLQQEKIILVINFLSFTWLLHILKVRIYIELQWFLLHHNVLDCLEYNYLPEETNLWHVSLHDCLCL